MTIPRRLRRFRVRLAARLMGAPNIAPEMPARAVRPARAGVPADAGPGIHIGPDSTAAAVADARAKAKPTPEAELQSTVWEAMARTSRREVEYLRQILRTIGNHANSESAVLRLCEAGLKHCPYCGHKQTRPHEDTPDGQLRVCAVCLASFEVFPLWDPTERTPPNQISINRAFLLGRWLLAGGLEGVWLVKREAIRGLKEKLTIERLTKPRAMAAVKADAAARPGEPEPVTARGRR